MTAPPAPTSSAPAPHAGKLLLCLDRSPSSEACIPYAVALARTFGSALTLVHVIHPRHQHGGPQASDALGWEIARQEAQRYLERQQADVELALGRAVEARLEQGRPGERIVELTRELGIELTLLGSRGERRERAFNLGSTAHQVLSLARSSVFIAHAGAVAPPVVAPRRVVVPLDGSLRAESALPAALRIARAHGAELLLVHVVQEPLPTPLLDDDEGRALARRLAEALKDGADRYLERLRQRLAHDGARVRTLVERHVNPRQRLLELVRQEESELIVLSAHGAACDSGRSFGSVTAHLLSHAAIPLLVLQDLPEHDRLRASTRDPSLARPALRASFASENP